jgi:hypothetical protein
MRFEVKGIPLFTVKMLYFPLLNTSAMLLQLYARVISKKNEGVKVRVKERCRRKGKGDVKPCSMRFEVC